MVHAEQLLNFALKFCSDRSRAEDLAQETLLLAWTNFHQFQLGTNCRAWLFKILINLRRKEHRRRDTLRYPFSIDQQNVDIAVAEDISCKAVVREALENLPADHRDILHFAGQGLSVRELAQRFAIPAGTVMSRLSRAREKLRSALGDQPKYPRGSVQRRNRASTIARETTDVNRNAAA
jgi:RNA polymerase sigma-70 factor (ECF subfamily)